MAARAFGDILISQWQRQPRDTQGTQVPSTRGPAPPRAACSFGVTRLPFRWVEGEGSVSAETAGFGDFHADIKGSPTVLASYLRVSVLGQATPTVYQDHGDTFSLEHLCLGAGGLEG